MAHSRQMQTDQFAAARSYRHGMSSSSGISPSNLDRTRARIVYALLGIFAGTAALVIALGAFGEAGATIVGAEVILLRVALGYYFAGPS